MLYSRSNFAVLKIYNCVFTAEDIEGQRTYTFQPSGSDETTFRINITDDDKNEREETFVVKPVVISTTDNDDVYIISNNRPHATFEIQIDGSNPDSESMHPLICIHLRTLPTSSLNCRNCVGNNEQYEPCVRG